MKVRLLCLEDGIIATGFRKMAGFVERVNADTEVSYVTTNKYRSFVNLLRGNFGTRGVLDAEAIDEVAQGLTSADLIGFSSMTGYSELTKAIIKRVREISPSTYLVWGGIHPIMHPEDAIASGVDAVCTGEGEMGFEQLHRRLEEGVDETDVKNFWFRKGDKVIRNGFLPLMTAEELATLPFPKFGEGETIYKRGAGFVPVTRRNYLQSSGLTYLAVWSIGCPFHCTYCGNTKFIANDSNYKRIRHPGVRYIIDEVKEVRRKLPHISSVQFHDDSFMAISLRELREFAECWKAELDIPFAVFGVIPNYVKSEKVEILTWAGMNKVRMGIQSGSQRILDFYKRPSPPRKVEAAGEVLASFSPRYHMPPSYDIIVDNPVETRQDVIDTLEMLYRMRRPYTLLVYSLKLIPNTELERLVREAGVDIEEISDGYSLLPPRWANLLLYLLCIVKPPRWLWVRMLKRVRASSEEQPMYPVTYLVLRFVHIVKRAAEHLRFMDFSNITGWPGLMFYKLGIISFWNRRVVSKYPKPELKVRRTESRPGPGIIHPPPLPGERPAVAGSVRRNLAR